MAHPVAPVARNVLAVGVDWVQLGVGRLDAGRVAGRVEWKRTLTPVFVVALAGDRRGSREPPAAPVPENPESRWCSLRFGFEGPGG